MPKKFWKKTVSKKALAVAKTVVAKTKAKRVRKALNANTDVHTVMIKVNDRIVPTQGVGVANYVYGQLQATPSASVWPGSVYNTMEFKHNSQQYDEFRMISMGMKVIPRQTQTTETDVILAESNASVLNRQGNDRIYVAHDRDGAISRSIQYMKQYASCKNYSTKRAFSVTPYKFTNIKNSWFDTSSPFSAPTAMIRAGGYYGGVTYYAEGLPELKGAILNNTWADVEIWYKVQFRGKVAMDITLSEPYTSVISTARFYEVPEIEGVSPAYWASTLQFTSSVVQNTICKPIVEDKMFSTPFFGFGAPDYITTAY